MPSRRENALLEHGKYSPEIIRAYDHYAPYLNGISIGTFVAVYWDGEGWGRAINDARQRVEINPYETSKLSPRETHENMARLIAIDTVDSALRGCSKDDCKAIMKDADALRSAIAARTLNHAICPDTYRFYSETLKEPNPAKYHEEQTERLLSALVANWKLYKNRDWQRHDSSKFRNFMKKQFNNPTPQALKPLPKRQTEVIPGLVPISFGRTSDMPELRTISDDKVVEVLVDSAAETSAPRLIPLSKTELPKLVPLEQTMSQLPALRPLEPELPALSPIDSGASDLPKLKPIEKAGVDAQRDLPKLKLVGGRTESRNLPKLKPIVRERAVESVDQAAPRTSYPKLTPIVKKEPAVSDALPRLTAGSKPISKPVSKPVRRRPQLVPVASAAVPEEEEEEQYDASLDDVSISVGWLRTFLGDNARALETTNLVFFAPSNSVAQQLVDAGQRVGKRPSTDAVVRTHLASLFGSKIASKTHSAVRNNEPIEVDEKCRVVRPRVANSNQLSFAGSVEISGCRVQVYCLDSLLKH